MTNYLNFKYTIILNGSPLLKDTKTVKVLAVPKALSPMQKTCLAVLTYLMVFLQTSNYMCLNAEMVHLYKHFVLCRSILSSMYWREACTMHKDKKETDGTYKYGAFVFIIKEYKN